MSFFILHFEFSFMLRIQWALFFGVIGVTMVPTQYVYALSCPSNLLTCGVTPVQTAGDADRDGYSVAAGDCDDTTASRSPGQLERCTNTIDDDCDGQVDEVACLPPSAAAITDLTAVTVRQVSVDLAWTAISPVGQPAGALRYDLRQSSAPIDVTSWETAAALAGTPAPSSAGSRETYTAVNVTPNSVYYFAVRLLDEGGQIHAQSNVIAVTTLGVETPTPDGTGMAGDTLPPPPVADLYAVPDYAAITLRWSWPGQSDAVRVKLIRNISPPVNPSDGATLLEGVFETAVDRTAEPGVTYHYAVFVYDHSANVSLPAFVSSSLLTPPADGSVVADTAGTRYLVEGGSLQPIPEAITVWDLGLDADSVITLPDSVIGRYPRGNLLTLSAAELLKRIDPDHDGLSNFDEVGKTTDPGNPDTDYDSYFDGDEVRTGHDPLAVPAPRRIDRPLVQRTRGSILLQVERQGQAWWVHPTRRERYYLRDGKLAYQIMRYLSLGISNADLAKIPRAGVDETGDPKLVARLSGQMLLAVEDLGKVWYVNPADGRRYYLRDGDAAYWVMRYRSRGITNANIEKIPIGTLRGKLQ